MTESLFRQEAVDNKSKSFISSSTMVSPLSFSTFSLFVVAVAVAVVAFVSLGKYSPKDTVRGYVTTTTGGVEVYAQSDGTILNLHVNEGETVTKGQELITLGTSRAVGHSAETRKEVIAALRLEQTDLLVQIEREGETFRVQQQGVADEISSLRERLDLLAEQREELVNALELSERALDRLTALEASEFVSQRDREVASAAIVEVKLRLKGLGLSADSIKSDIRRNQQRLAEIPVLREARAAEMRVEHHQLSIKIIENMGRNTQSVRAPSGGIVSGLLVRDGQTISSNSPLLNLIPEYGDFYVEVLVPTRTIAFVHSGAPVRIRYDAYPFQKFGTHGGFVESVSQTTVLPTDKRFRIDIAEPVYIARVRIADQAVLAYGEQLPLQSGMTLTADVLRDERRLIEWIFDPLISATRRL